MTKELFRAYCWKCRKGVGFVRRYHDLAVDGMKTHARIRHYNDSIDDVGYSIVSGPDRSCIRLEIKWKRDLIEAKS